MDTHNPQFKRWYDLDLHLSELVNLMEQMSEESQVLFAHLMRLMSDELIRTNRRQFIDSLDWQKLRGIFKSKQGRRWYDQEPNIHKAFNLLYSLQDEHKAAVARELYVPSQIVGEYETRCREEHTNPDIEVVCRIVELVFREETDKARAQFSPA